MAQTGGARSLLATLVGWIVIGIIVWFLFGWLVGTILWVLRTILVIVVVLGLITLYFKLKSPQD